LIVQLLKEQNKYDQMPSSLLNQLQCVLPLADKVADEIVGEETEILYKMPRMFGAMQKVAKLLCDYVKRGRFSRLSLFWIPQILMIAERTRSALMCSEDKEVIDGIDGELENVINDFLRAVESLNLVKRIGKHTLSQYSASPFSVALCRPRVPAQVS
jgi:hypothetical protein